MTYLIFSYKNEDQWNDLKFLKYTTIKWFKVFKIYDYFIIEYKDSINIY